MGKIIEFKSKHDLDIGTILWVVGKKDMRKYKPCPTCDNTRSIKVHDNENNEYEIPCPRCSNIQTKGGECKDFVHYKAMQFKIERFVLEINYRSMSPHSIIVLSNCDRSGDYGVGSTKINNSENLIADSDWENSPTQYYITEEEAKAEAKRLNAEQAMLIKEFLETETA